MFYWVFLRVFFLLVYQLSKFIPSYSVPFEIYDCVLLDFFFPSIGLISWLMGILLLSRFGFVEENTVKVLRSLPFFLGVTFQILSGKIIMCWHSRFLSTSPCRATNGLVFWLYFTYVSYFYLCSCHGGFCLLLFLTWPFPVFPAHCSRGIRACFRCISKLRYNNKFIYPCFNFYCSILIFPDIIQTAGYSCCFIYLLSYFWL